MPSRRNLSENFKRRILQCNPNISENEKSLLTQNIDSLFNSISDVTPFEEVGHVNDFDSLFGRFQNSFSQIVPRYDFHFNNLQRANQMLDTPHSDFLMHLYIQNSHTDDNGKIVTDVVSCEHSFPSDLMVACNDFHQDEIEGEPEQEKEPGFFDTSFSLFDNFFESRSDRFIMDTMPSFSFFDFGPQFLFEPEFFQPQFSIHAGEVPEMSDFITGIVPLDDSQSLKSTVEPEHIVVPEQSVKTFTVPENETQYVSTESNMVHAYGLANLILCFVLLFVFCFGYNKCLKKSSAEKTDEKINSEKEESQDASDMDVSYLPMDDDTHMVDINEGEIDQLVKVSVEEFGEELQEKLLPVTEEDLESLCAVILPDKDFSIQNTTKGGI